LRNCTVTAIRTLFAAGLMLFATQSAAQSTDIRDILRSELACRLIEPVFADMPVAPLFTMNDNSCEAVTPDDVQRDYFSDNVCTQPLLFSATDLVEHCALLLDSTGLGEGNGIRTDSWTLSPGSRFDLGARPLDNVQLPYMQRTIYRRVDNAAGECALEMRIYTASPGLENLKPMIAFHGGSWSGRGFGFFGLEMSIPHYVERGFVVFAPFYRLLGDNEGSAACHNATVDDIVDDANAALDWVQAEGNRFGASGKPVTFGQSAGAHLGLSLASYRADEISGAVLMYPPTDFSDFALRVGSGAYTNEQGLGILRRVLQLDEAADISSIDVSASPVPENSFPQRVVEDGLTPAPLFIIHGLEDDLVEARQSARLCNALVGDTLMPIDAAPLGISTLRATRNCGEDSELQLIREGQHALDVCIAGTVIPTDLCFSGSEESRLEVAAAIGDAGDFAADVANRVEEPVVLDGVTEDGASVDSADESGGGSLSSLVYLLWLVTLFRWFNQTHCCFAGRHIE